MNARMTRANHIDDKIIEALKVSERPLSTRELCFKIDRAWHTVDSHCLKLQIDGKLGVIRAGNITLWHINGNK